jgi:putative ABC transport system permease protein
MFLKFAYLNLFRNKRRTFSTGLAICIGFVGLNLLGAYIYRVKKALDTTSVYSALNGHLKVYKKDSLTNFSLQPQKYIFQGDDLLTAEKVFESFRDKIEYIGKNLNGTGLLSNGTISQPVMFISFEPEIYAKSLLRPEISLWAKDWILPSQFESVKVFEQNNEVISVTPKIAGILGVKYPLSQNESLQLAGRTLDGDLNAVNVDLGAEHTTGMQFLEDTLILVPLKKVQELFGTEGNESFSLYLKRGVSLKPFKAELDRKLAEAGLNTESYFYYDEKINSVYLGTMGFLYVMGGFFVFLIGTAVSLTIINSLTMGIIERTREIGTLLAVGFQRKQVSRLFILENILVCLFAVVAGLILSYLIASLVNQLNIRFTPPGVSGKIQFKLVWNVFIAAGICGFVVLLTFFSSLFVMKNREKTKLIDLINDAGA